MILFLIIRVIQVLKSYYDFLGSKGKLLGAELISLITVACALIKITDSLHNLKNKKWSSHGNMTETDMSSK